MTPAPTIPTTRDKLIEAAFRVVARDGLEAASVKLIATEAGVTPGLVHYHFATKEAVIEAALRHGLHDYLARWQARREGSAPHRQIELMFGAIRAMDPADIAFFKVRLAIAARAISDHGLSSLIGAVNASLITEYALVFAAMNGEATASDRDVAIATTLNAAFDGLMLAMINDRGFPIVDASEILEQAAIGWVEQPRLF